MKTINHKDCSNNSRSQSSCKLLSIVIPIFNEEGNINELYTRLTKVLKKTSFKYEIIFIDDGSSDQSLHLIEELHSKDLQVKYVSFSRNFGHQCALTAGFDYAQGDAVITMDADLQHPPELVEDLVKYWKEGYPIVYTIRKTTEKISYFKKYTAKVFYALFRLFCSEVIEQNTSDFRLLDRRVCDIIRQHREYDRFYRGMIVFLGFNKKVVEFNADERFSGQSGYTVIKMIRFAISGLLSYSHIPVLTTIFMIAFLFFLTVSYSLYILYQKIITGQIIPGQASILLTILLIGSVQMMATAINTLYLYKCFREIKGRPIYIVDRMKGFNNTTQ